MKPLFKAAIGQKLNRDQLRPRDIDESFLEGTVIARIEPITNEQANFVLDWCKSTLRDGAWTHNIFASPKEHGKIMLEIACTEYDTVAMAVELGQEFIGFLQVENHKVDQVDQDC